MRECKNYQLTAVNSAMTSGTHVTSRIVVHCCPFLSIVAHCCPLLPIVAHCCPCPIVSHCCPLYLRLFCLLKSRGLRVLQLEVRSQRSPRLLLYMLRPYTCTSRYYCVIGGLMWSTLVVYLPPLARRTFPR